MADQQNNRPSPYLDENHEPYGKPDTQPNPNDGNNQFRPNALDEHTLRSARSQTTFAFIAGPLSLFVGRRIASREPSVRFARFQAYRKLHSLAQKSNDTASMARGMLQVLDGTALIICLVAVTLNAVSFVIMFPVIEQMLQSGDFASIAGNMSAGTAAGTSTWGCRMIFPEPR